MAAALTINQLQNLVPSAFATSPHESRSSKYTYIPTSVVIHELMKNDFLPARATQSKSRVEGKTEFTKHMIRFRHASSQVVKVGDSLPEIVLINSHDGTSAYKLMGGLFRLVCSNGMVVSDSMCAELSVHHKGNIVDDVIEGSFRVLDDTQKALGVSAEWQGLHLGTAEQQIFAEAAHELRFADADGNIDTPIRPDQLLAPRRWDDRGNDLWRTFNRVQENVIRGGLTARGDRDTNFRRVTTREVKGIDQDVKLNRALWTLTQRMAELKAA